MNQQHLFIMTLEHFVYYETAIQSLNCPPNVENVIPSSIFSLMHTYNFNNNHYASNDGTSFLRTREIMLYLESYFYFPVANTENTTVMLPTQINSSLHAEFNENEILEVNIKTEQGTEGIIYDQLKASYCMIQEFLLKDARLKKTDSQMLYRRFVWLQNLAYKVNNETNIFVNGKPIHFKIPFDNSYYTQYLEKYKMDYTETFGRFKNLTTIINDKRNFPVFRNTNYPEGYCTQQDMVKSLKLEKFLDKDSLKNYIINSNDLVKVLYENKIITKEHHDLVVKFLLYIETNEYKVRRANPMLEIQALERRLEIREQNQLQTINEINNNIVNLEKRQQNQLQAINEINNNVTNLEKRQQNQLQAINEVNNNIAELKKSLTNYNVNQNTKINDIKNNMNVHLTNLTKSINDVEQNMKKSDRQLTQSFNNQLAVVFNEIEKSQKGIELLKNDIKTLDTEVRGIDNEVANLKEEKLEEKSEAFNNDEIINNLNSQKERRSTLGRVYDYVRSWFFWSNTNQTVETIPHNNNAEDINDNNQVVERSILRKVYDYVTFWRFF